MIMAGVALNGCVFGMLFVPNKPMTRSKQSLCKSYEWSMLLNVNYTLFTIANCLQVCQINVLYLLATSRAVSKGMTKLEGSMLITCIGLASTVSRVAASWISNRKGTSHISMYTGCTVALSILLSISCAKADNFIFTSVLLTLAGLNIGKMYFFLEYLF